MKFSKLILNLMTVTILTSASVWASNKKANCENKNFVIYAVKMTSLHTALIIPNDHKIFKNEFQDSSHLIVNWGSELFYRAGENEEKILAAAPAALLAEGPAVVYIKPTNIELVESLVLYSSAAKIYISEAELVKLEQAILALVKKDAQKEFEMSVNAEELNNMYEANSIFYKSSVTYKGLRLTCNGMVGDLLSNNTDNFGKFSSYMPGPLMDYLKEKSTNAANCIEWSTRD